MAEKLSKAEMIDELVYAVDNWDIDTLVMYAQTAIRQDLNKCSLAVIKKEYKDLIGEEN